MVSFEVPMKNQLLYENEKRYALNAPMLKDLNTGEMVTIVCPAYFELETVLVNSAYYRLHNKEHRFLIFDARLAGLKIAK